MEKCQVRTFPCHPQPSSVFSLPTRRSPAGTLTHIVSDHDLRSRSQIVYAEWVTCREQGGPILASGDAKLVVAGDAVDRGIYDPSIAYAPDGRTGWLAYSSVTGTGNLVRGRLA